MRENGASVFSFGPSVFRSTREKCTLPSSQRDQPCLASSARLYPGCIFRSDRLGGLAWTLPKREYYELSSELLGLLQHLDQRHLTLSDLAHRGYAADELQTLLDQGMLATHPVAPWPRFQVPVSAHLNTVSPLPPLVVEWYPHFGCNQKCSFCYVARHTSSSSPGATKAQAAALLKHLRGAGVFKLALLGGEPMLWPELPQFLDDSASLPLDVSISTNGTDIRDDVLAAIARHPTCQVTISLQASDPRTHDRVTGFPGAFRKIRKNVERMRQAGIRYGVACVFRSEAAKDLIDMVTFCGRVLHADCLTFLYQHNIGATSGRHSYFESFERFFGGIQRRATQYGMRVNAPNPYAFLSRYRQPDFAPPTRRSKWLYGPKDGKIRLEVDPQGDIYPSYRVFGNRQYCIGNIYKTRLSDAWCSSPIPQRITRRVLAHECRACSHRPICGGGCIFENLLLHGSLSPRPPACPLYRRAPQDSASRSTANGAPRCH